jgi:glycosyltransferase involved in cell wall biosynthesis
MVYPAVVRVVMLVANPITYDGRVMRHAKTLADAGHHVTVIGVIGPGDRTEPPPPSGFSFRRIDRSRHGLVPRLRWATTALRQRTARRLCAQLSPGDGARTAGAVRARIFTELSALGVATSAPELFAEAVRLRPDAVHANDLNTLPAAAWTAAVCGCPYVYDAHELYCDEHPDLTRLERRMRAAVEQRYVPGATAVLTVNELIADHLAGLYRLPRPVVLRNLPRSVTVPPPASRPPPQPGVLRLLYHGAHVGLDQHGVDDILRALRRLRDRVKVGLTLRGYLRPVEAQALLRRLLELQIRDAVRIADPVPGAEALVAAAAADGADVGLAVHPPLCQSYVYTTSSKLYEYQAAGLAVCASDVLGNRHTVAPGAGVFYPPGDDARLAGELFELAMHPERLRAMQQAAFAHAEATLRWELESKRLLEVYNRL